MVSPIMRLRSTAVRSVALATLLLSAYCSVHGACAQDGFRPGARTTLDAHNCYPYEGQWSDRIDRALATGTPIAIEQDLFWYTDPLTHLSRSVLAHTPVLKGDEPILESYFFERIRPLVEAELRHPHPERWPLLTLNLDIKTEEYEHLHAIWNELQIHQDWLTTALNVSDASKAQPLHPGPILVLAGNSDRLEQVFRKEVPIGGQLLVFGAIHKVATDTLTSTEDLDVEPASNYRRWWNNSWAAVEPGGPSKAGDWTPSLNMRLRRMVQQAHAQGLWIRFYTLDGETLDRQHSLGLFRTYNFPSLAAAKLRWRAAIEAGTDYIATDQYDDLRRTMNLTSFRK